jgi:arginyl-tRNA synthetase
VIPADLSAELASAISAAIAAGDLPPGAARLRASGTWRPAPLGPVRPGPVRPETVPGRSAGSYATSLPFGLARLAGQEPAAVAARLAGALRPADWISSAESTGDGYLTIEVTGAALASLAVRITRAGLSCARSDALAGVTRAAPPLPDLAAEPGWRQAWRDQAAALAGRLAAAAGATVVPGPQPELSGSGRPAGPDSVADAVAYAGADAVRYWLARMPTGRTGGLGREIPVTSDLAYPWYLVSFAHTDAASVRRWAADLGLRRAEPDGWLAGLLGEPAELALLTQLSWLAERVAGAARRGRPAEVPRYLEELAAAWLDCRESCPALPFGGRAAPRDQAGISARLWLADATRTVLASGLGLVGVAPREWLPANARTASVVL